MANDQLFRENQFQHRHCHWPFLITIFLLMLFSCWAQNQTNSKENGATAAQLKTADNKKIKFDKTVYCGFKDQNGMLWFGTLGDGLYRYDGSSFTQYTKKDGLNDNTIMSMIEDRNGNLWLGTTDGLCKYDGQSFSHIPIPFSDTSSVWLDKVYPIINPNAVHSLLEDKDGHLWIGTGGAGAYRFDGENFTSFLSETGQKMEDDLHHNWITSMIEDNNENLWFSSMSRGGATRYDGEHFSLFMPEDGLHTDMVRTIFQDKSGDIWIGYKATHDGGLTRYDGDTFVNYSKTDGLCNHSIRVIFEDQDGRLWMGGDLNNLCVYDGQAFVEFKTKENTTFDGILTVLEDTEGNIWFGGKHGLWKYNGESVVDMTIQ